MHADIVARVDPNEVNKADFTSLLCHKGIIFSGDDQGVLMAWTANLKKLGEVKAHTKSITSFAFMADVIYTCSEDGSVKAWTTDLKLVETLATEECKFWKLTVSENVLFAGANNGLIYLFENNTLQFKVEIQDGVKDMVISENNVISVKDMNVLVTELMNGNFSEGGPYIIKERFKKLLYTVLNVIGGKCNMKTSFPGNAPLLLVGDKLLAVGANGLDLDIRENSSKLNYEKITTLKDAHRKIINGLVGTVLNNQWYVYTAGFDKMIKQWKLKGKKLEIDTHFVAKFVINDIVSPEAGSVYAGGEHGHLIHVMFSD